MTMRKPPELISLYIRSCLIGFAVAAAFVGALLAFDVANLQRLVLGSDVGVLAALILWVANGIVFAGVQFGIAIMGMADKSDDDDDWRGGQLIPIPVRSSDRR